MFKFLAVVIIVILIFVFIQCKTPDNSELLTNKYNCVKSEQEHDIPILTFNQADEILSSFLNEENRKITFIDNKLSISLGKENLNYNMIFDFVFNKNNETMYYLGCDKKIICNSFACNVLGTALTTAKDKDYKCTVSGYMFFNVEGETCMFPFTITIDTNLKDNFKSLFEFKFDK